MRLLVTGATGQLGAEILQRADPAIECIGLARATLDVGDASAVEAVVQRHSPAVVLNCAAFTSVDASETDREAAFRANATGPGNLAASCARHGIALIHVSTDYVFDGAKKTPYREADPVNPINAYGMSKAAGEAAVRQRLEHHVIVRTAWVFSGHGRNNFVRTMLDKARTAREIRVVADQIGCPTPSADLARALIDLASRAVEREPVWGTLHYCGAGPVSRFEFARAIIAAAFPNRAAPLVTPITLAETRDIARRPACSALDCRRYAEIAGHAPRPWREGLAEVVPLLMAR